MTNTKNAVPLVSIGMPVYNGENFIREAIDSILGQTFQDFELIISDNASTDGTEAICREYAAKDQRIRYCRNAQNLGAAPNYNIVVTYAKGKYFKWASHDDILAPEFIEKCVEALENNPSVVLVYPRVSIIDKCGNLQKKFSPDIKLSSVEPSQRLKKYLDFTIEYKDEPIFGVVRANALKKTHLIGKFVGSDITLLGELAILGHFYEVPDYLFLRRRHSKSSVPANFEYHKRILWFDPNYSGLFVFVYCKLMLAYLDSINRTSIPWKQKIFCYFYVASYIVKRKSIFRQELQCNIERLFGFEKIFFWG